MSDFAQRRFGARWRRSRKVFDDPDSSAQLYIPWSVYHFTVEGRPIVDWFVEERASALDRGERAWLEAQRLSWLSIWEVETVASGSHLGLRDLLSGERRQVHDVKASSLLVDHDAILGRVVDHEGVSLICGVHPRFLSPSDAAPVVRRALGRIRRRGAVPVARLRDDKMTRFLIARWEDAVEEVELRRLVPPRLQNTDGEDIVQTVDRFELDPAAHAKIAACLRAMVDAEEADAPGPGEETLFDFLRPGNAMHRSWENTLVGRARLARSALALETNSSTRADALRRHVQDACGDDLRHVSREQTPAAELFARVGEARPPSQPPEPPPPEMAEAVREFKQRHYADWLDQPIPALGGRTPRQAAGLVRGRQEVDTLLKQMENREARLPREQRADFSLLRRELRLDR